MERFLRLIEMLWLRIVASVYYYSFYMEGKTTIDNFRKRPQYWTTGETVYYNDNRSVKVSKYNANIIDKVPYANMNKDLMTSIIQGILYGELDEELVGFDYHKAETIIEFYLKPNGCKDV